MPFLKIIYMPHMQVISILFSKLNISTLIKINIMRMMEAAEEEHVWYTGLLSHPSWSKVTLEHPCWNQWVWLAWLGSSCSPQVSPVCGWAHFAGKGQRALSDFALRASCSVVHLLQLRAMLKELSGDTLLTVRGEGLSAKPASLKTCRIQYQDQALGLQPVIHLPALGMWLSGIPANSGVGSPAWLEQGSSLVGLCWISHRHKVKLKLQ